jgi:hypothetical protein
MFASNVLIVVIVFVCGIPGRVVGGLIKGTVCVVVVRRV